MTASNLSDFGGCRLVQIEAELQGRGQQAFWQGSLAVGIVEKQKEPRQEEEKTFSKLEERPVCMRLRARENQF